MSWIVGITLYTLGALRTWDAILVDNRYRNKRQRLSAAAGWPITGVIVAGQILMGRYK